MKIEKGIRIKLPASAEYRRVEVTDRGILVIYAEENHISKALPKPPPLIGGTEVYQKEGLPYWFCKIKDRDEFMSLYFGDLSSDDVRYTADGKRRKFVTEKQKKFRKNVLKALNMPTEGFRWIPVYEPSLGEDNNLQYVAGKEVLRKLTVHEWEEKCQNYSPENESKMATITTYFLLLLRLMKDGFATLEQVADNSKEIGHFWDSNDAKYEFEKTGERQLGGLYGFVGNTRKIVKDSESSTGFSLLGGTYRLHGDENPLANVVRGNYPGSIKADGVALLELIK